MPGGAPGCSGDGKLSGPRSGGAKGMDVCAEIEGRDW